MNEYPKTKMKQSWIQDQIDEEAVQWAESFGKFLTSSEGETGPLTTSQIRRFYGELKRIQADPSKFQADIPMLKAKLAYAVGRDVRSHNPLKYKSKIKEFYVELAKGIDEVRKNNKNDFINFVKIVEAIVAYHKYHGGK
jgi:CRISPR-associated protein Csm2